MGTHTYPRASLKPPKGFSEGKPEAASEARPEAKTPRGRNPCGLSTVCTRFLQLVDEADRMSEEGQVGGRAERQQLDPGEGGSRLQQHQHRTQEGPRGSSSATAEQFCSYQFSVWIYATIKALFFSVLSLINFLPFRSLCQSRMWSPRAWWGDSL